MKPMLLVIDMAGSYDREHEAASLHYMDGKIASVMPVADAVARIACGAQP